MPHLRNPSGRIVCIDDQKEYESYLLKPGFVKLTEEEENEFVTERYKVAAETSIRKEEVKQDKYIRGVYLSTVAEGGKDGYGVASEKLVKELINVDVDVSRYYKDQKVGLLFHNPYSVLKMENPIKVIYTMFESTKIPNDWVDYLKSADKVLVPSRWCRDVFKKSGVDAEVVPLGFDDDVYTYHERENKSENKKPFVFLHYNAFNIRKGFLELFKAFTQEFDPTEPVKLILKTTLDHPPIPILKDKYPNIEVICEKYREAEMVELLNNSDCFVFPSRGEGFGLTPIECMATGMPAIVPNAHGISEYFDKECMYEVKIKEECPGIYQKYKGEDVGNMFVCDVDDLRKKMRYVYEHQKEALEMGKRASRYVRQWTYRKTAMKLKTIIEDMYNLEVKNKKDSNVLQLVEVK